MSKETEVDAWVICPVCNNRLKKENLPAHMKRVHKQKIDDVGKKSLETSHKKSPYKKRQEHKTPRIISKTTIAVITIICVVLVAAILVYFFSYSKGSNDQNDKINYIVSIDGKGDFSSIQKAIDAASENDIIFVNNGTYLEKIKITKSIKLIGADTDTTIITGNGSGDVIYVLADSVTISSFTIKNGGSKFLGEVGAGVELRSNYSTISNCNISSNTNYGLYLGGYSGETIKENTITFNTFSKNAYGLYSTFNVKTTNIVSNSFTDNAEYGMFLTSQSDDSLVSDNIFTENNYAIRIKSSERNTIIKNLIMNNIKGLYFCCGSLNNVVYNNLFINNTDWNAQDDTTNTWGNGEVGNYWDDYTGIDANGDGIGDTPYIINGEKEDRFPLMKPNFSLLN